MNPQKNATVRLFFPNSHKKQAAEPSGLQQFDLIYFFAAVRSSCASSSTRPVLSTT